MGVQLSEEEAWRFVEAAHTGCLTTLRTDGYPVPLPVWFVALDGAVYVRTPEHTKKVGRVRRDSRAAFLVETGRAWEELQAVLLVGDVSILDDAELEARVAGAFDEKYRSYRPAAQALPDATRRHYGSDTATIRFVPVQPPISWDNRRIRLRRG